MGEECIIESSSGTKYVITALYEDGQSIEQTFDDRAEAWFSFEFIRNERTRKNVNLWKDNGESMWIVSHHYELTVDDYARMFHGQKAVVSGEPTDHEGD